jgi:hypothetical protein
VVGSVFLAVTAGVATNAILPESAFAASAAVAAVIGIVLAWRLVDGLLTFAIAVLLAGTIEHWTDLSLRYLDEISIPVMALAILVAHRDRLRLPRPGLREAALGLLLLAGVASSLLNAVPASVWIPGAVLLVKGIAFFYLVVSLKVDESDLRRTAVVVGSIGAVIVAIGFVELLAPTAVQQALGLPRYQEERGGLTVVKSIFLHPALYGWLTAFGSLFLYARFAVVRDRLSLLGALVLNVGTLLSGRRTPLVGVVAGLVVGAIRQATGGWLAPRIWAPVAAVLIGFVVLSFPVLGSFYRATITDYLATPEQMAEIFRPDPDPTVLRQMQPRVGLYLGSVAVARDEFPFGAGIGRFGSQMSREVYSPVYAEYGMDQMYGIKQERPIAVTDTFWPMILGETGMLGLVGALGFFGIIGRELWVAVGRAAEPGLRAFLLGALLIYVEGLVRSLTSPAFVAAPIAFFIFGTIGLALAAARGAGAGAKPILDN